MYKRIVSVKIGGALQQYRQYLFKRCIIFKIWKTGFLSNRYQCKSVLVENIVLLQWVITTLTCLILQISQNIGGLVRRRSVKAECGNIRKMAATKSTSTQRDLVVGAVGYAEILQDSRLPVTDFFYPGRRFRLRLR